MNDITNQLNRNPRGKSFAVTKVKEPQTCKCCGQVLSVTSELHFEERTRTVLRNGWLASLSNQEFLVLKYLAQIARPVTRDLIIDKLYEHDPNGGPDGTKTLDVICSKLNRKIRNLKLYVASDRGPGAMRYLDYR